MHIQLYSLRYLDTKYGYQQGDVDSILSQHPEITTQKVSFSKCISLNSFKKVLKIWEEKKWCRRATYLDISLDLLFDGTHRIEGIYIYENI